MAERIPIFFDVSTGRLVAAQKQLDRTRAKTRGLTKSAGFLNSQFKTLGVTLLATFGAIAVLSAFRNILKSLKDLEFQMSKVAAISGATSDQMVKLRDNAIQVGAASKFTATEVGKLQEELARLGFTTTEILKLTDSISALAIVADRELGPTALAVAKTLNAFNLSADDGARVVNVMAESFANSALDLEKFDAAMRNVGPAAKAMGFSLEKTTAILAVLVDRGIEASKAGTDLRRILINNAKAGITLEESFEILNASTERVKTSFQLFGARAVVAGEILSSNTEELKLLEAQFSDTTREMDAMRRIMEDNLETDLKKLQSAFDALIQKGTPLNELIRDIVNGLRDWVNVINDVEPSIKDLKDQIVQAEEELRVFQELAEKKPFGEGIFSFLNAQAKEAERQIDRVRGELINLKLELSAQEFIEAVGIAESSKIISQALKEAFASDDIEKFIDNLKETQEREEIIARIRRIQADELAEANLRGAIRAEQLKKEEDQFIKNTNAANELTKFRLELDIKLASSIEDRIDNEILLEELKAALLLKNDQLLADERVKIEEELQARLAAIREKGRGDIEKRNEEDVKDRKQGLTNVNKLLKEDAEEKQRIRDEELEAELNLFAARTQLSEAINDLGRAAVDASKLFAAENTALGKSLFLFQKAAALATVIVRGAEERAIIAATSPDPFTKTVRLVAQGIRQAAGIATIVTTAIAGFKEGVIDYQGEGTATSDSNLVRISKGESIIKASATAKSKELLESINAGRINDELSDILLNNKIMGAGNGDVVNALMGVNKSIKKLPIHQTFFNEHGVSNYILKEHSRIKYLGRKFYHGK